MKTPDRQLTLSLAHVAVDALFDLSPAGVAKASIKGVLRQLEKRGKGAKRVDPAAIAGEVATALQPFFEVEGGREAFPVARDTAVRLLQGHAPSARRINDLARDPSEIAREITRQGSRELDGLDAVTEIPLVVGLLRHTYHALVHHEAARVWLAADLERRLLVVGERTERIEGKLDLIIETTPERDEKLFTFLQEVLAQADGGPEEVRIPSAAVPIHPAYESEEHRELVTQLKAAHHRRGTLLVAGDDTSKVDEEILDLKRRLRSGPELKAGDILAGRFELFDILGRGGFATVWRAYDSSHQEFVAVKVLRGEHSGDRSRRERFFRGARQMAMLDHPGIVRVIEEEGEDGGYHFFAMEYAEGGDLRRAVLEGKLTREEAVEKVLEIGDALQHAHDAGLVHRDVKPSNILLFADGRPKLTDFDLVRAADTTGGTHTRAMLGTFLYAAPEVLADAKTAGPRADVFSLGMTLAFALHGADLPLEMLKQTDRFVAALGCPAGVRKAVLQATAWGADERQGSVAELVTALGKGLKDAGPESEPESRPQRTRHRVNLDQQEMATWEWVENELCQLPADERSEAVLTLVTEARLPSLEDLRPFGVLAWALDYYPGRSVDELQQQEAEHLRRVLMQPLREHRSPPAVDELLLADIPGGTFAMGGPEGEGGDNERPQHEVTLSPFRLGTTPVTCLQLRRLLPDHSGEDDHPVVEVDWDTAYAYAAWLGGRLPTEAEWEYACRAGTTTRYWSGDSERDLSRVGWYSENSGEQLQSVASKPANPWGLHDMHGLVREWVADRYGSYLATPQINPWSPPGGRRRGVRGGSFWLGARWARSACRYFRGSRVEFGDQGFRVALPATPWSGL